jgi:uncharacterized oligopeptide transporter (OPT) family protein
MEGGPEGGRHCMHLVHHQLLKGLALRDIACIQIELDLILTIAKLHGGMVMTLVDIFVDELDASDGANALYIDMALILPEQKDAERNDKAIINCLAIGEGIYLSSVATVEVGIGVIRDGGLLTERS